MSQGRSIGEGVVRAMKMKVDTGSRGTGSKLLWALCALVLGVVCTTVFFLAGPGKRATEPVATEEQAPEAATEAEVPVQETEQVAEPADPASTRAILASWDEESEAYVRLTSFVEGVCDPTSDSYLPPEERVATFDMDGTFICERAPVYIDMAFICWHVLEDPTYEAPADIRAAVESVMDEVRAGIVPERVNLNTVLAQAYEGRTPDELMADVVRFAETTEVAGFDNMTYAQSFYVPMLEVIEYLRANDFDVYVVTACERYVSRALAVEYADFDPTHVVGTDLVTEATGQDGEDGLDYTFTQDDELVIVAPHVIETGKTNKVIAIQNEIGRRPVLSFGNSSGDFAMLNYATANPDHEGIGFLVIADDLAREYGNEGKAASMRDEVAKEGWVGISMRDDWTSIYGPNVEKTELPEDEYLAEAA